MVQLGEDGTLIYFGRKEDIVPLQGHAVDVSGFEAQLAKHLPSSVRAAVALLQPSGNTDQEAGRELLVLIELPPNEAEDHVQILPSNHDISWSTTDMGSLTTTFAATMPVSLASHLKKFDKFVQSIPSQRAPFAYAAVEKLPTRDGSTDHTLLNRLAGEIPHALLSQLRNGFKEACQSSLLQGDLTAPETILRSAWAKILSLRPEQIEADDNFFRLGGDSVLAMKLVSSLRAEGHGLTVADVFQHMRLGDAAKVLKVDKAAVQEKLQPHKPFSIMPTASDVDTSVTDVVRAQLADRSWSIQDILPVTDSQALDVRATVSAPRTSVQYTMLYFSQGSIYRKQLLRACNELIKTHEILRTVFVELDSSLLQVVLAEAITAVTTQVADGDNLDEFIKSLCDRDIEGAFPLGSPFFRIFHVQARDSSQECLVLRLSHAQYDGVSLPRLLRDLETLYTGGEITSYHPFSTYLSLTLSPQAQSSAITYWAGLLADSAPSVVPSPSLQLTGDPTLDAPVFITQPVVLSQPLQHITRATLLTTAWGLLLARRLGVSDVVFGAVTSGRGLPHTDVVQGPAYQITPVRVTLSQGDWTARSLLDAIQSQTAASSAYDYLGFRAIAAGSQRPGWEGHEFFDSVVHHQDEGEDFDVMPFAGGEARVEIANPAGDGPRPLKVVSYLKDGEFRVGVVGTKGGEDVVKGLVEELKGVVEELVEGLA
jgi:aryl carrier-like protein